MESIDNDIREDFAHYLEDTNRQVSPILREYLTSLRATASHVRGIRERLASIRARAAAAAASTGATVPVTDKNTVTVTDKNARV